MAGTKAGGIKASQTNRERHGEGFYAKIGAKGGANGNTGGFAAKVPCHCDVFSWSHTIPECAGFKGGRKSRRGPARRINASAK